MADQRIQHTERMVGAGHPTLTDTLNRLVLIEHNTDGTHKKVTLSNGVTLQYDTIDTLNGQDNFISNKVSMVLSPAPEQQLGLFLKVIGGSTLAPGIFRIPLAIRAETGGATTTADGLDAANIVVQQNDADAIAYLNGLEIGFNNLKRNDPLNPSDANHFGMTIDAYGGFSIGPAALAIRTGAANSNWQRGVWIPANTITSGGYAFDYAGNGSNDGFKIKDDGSVSIQGKVVSFASAAPTTGAHTIGDKVFHTSPIAASPLGWECTASGTPGTWKPMNRPHSVSGDNGDAPITLTAGSSDTTVLFNTPITADRAVTLSTTGAYKGSAFRITRRAGATGAFNINVGTGPLKALATAGTWCDVEFDGSTWVLTAYGSL